MCLRVFVISIIGLLCTSVSVVHAETVTLSGTVTDASTLEPVPFATVLLLGTDRGTLTDDFGRYSLSTALPFDSVCIGAMGYRSLTVAAPSRQPGMKLNIHLKPTGVLLGTVVAKPRKEHYSKRNNPAVDFMERIRAARDLGDPRRRHPDYNYDKYERITLAINDFHHKPDSTGKAGKFDFVQEYVDTSLLSGKPILNITVREKVSEVHHRRDPKGEKEYVTGVRSAGMDEFLDPQSTQKLYEDVMREIDVYQNDIPLLQQRFVSPLSRIAPDFYKFYLTDTVTIDSVRCAELTFVPRNAATMGFTGRFYVELGDSTMFIRRIMMRVPHDINLNFVKDMLVTQEFARDTDGTRLKTSDEMILEATLIPGLPGLYARRLTLYSGHDYTPLPDDRLFARGGDQIYDPAARRRDDSFWIGERKAPQAHGEAGMAMLMKRFRAVPLFYWGEKAIRVFSKGYVPTGTRSRFDIGPLTSTISHNTVEGLRLRLGGITTANLSPRWFGRGYAAYGFKDHRWKYGVEAEYSFHDKEYHSREFPVHALRATHSYDMKMLGQSFITNNQDNMFLSWRRAEDIQMIYRRLTKLEYLLEFENNFSLTARVQHERLEPTRWMSFITGSGIPMGHIASSAIAVELRYAPGEKFYQMTTGRLPINLDAPVFTLTHTWAPPAFATGGLGTSTTEASFSKRFWFSAFGYLDAIMKGGHTWTRTPWPSLLIPNANLSYFIQAETFPLMNPMEFINDSYLQLDLTYWANGAILNYIPLLRKLKLREALIFRGLWGHLSSRNRPWLHPELPVFPEATHTQLMTAMPYMEAGVGIDNIFKVLRVDYTWRLSYRSAPGACLGGVRFMFHFSF